MNDVCETLFEPLAKGFVKSDGRVLFMNAQHYPFLPDGVVLQQGFKPCVDELGTKVLAEIPDGAYDLVLHLFPKNMIEGRYQIAQALERLQKGGVLVCAAENKAGGSRLEKIFADFGFSDVQNISKNKARVVWGRAENIQASVVKSALSEGAEQNILDGQFISQPGVFGWNKIDVGSALLAQNLPRDLKGKGADYGCGYGYLSRFVLENIKDVQSLICIDADYRAVELCRKNLQKFSDRVSFLWCDLTKSIQEKNLDFIVMNPPFHEGKKTDTGVGADFIKSAVQALRKGGVLWMVANTHLPYEIILQSHFLSVKMVAQGGGFKVFQAIK